MMQKDKAQAKVRLFGCVFSDFNDMGCLPRSERRKNRWKLQLRNINGRTDVGLKR